jgi:hypothetical protein
MVSMEGPTGRIVAKLERSCGGFVLLRQRWLLVNQGLHGMTIFDTANHQLRAVATQKTPDPAERLWVSDDTRYVLALRGRPDPRTSTNCFWISRLPHNGASPEK